MLIHSIDTSDEAWDEVEKAWAESQHAGWRLKQMKHAVQHQNWLSFEQMLSVNVKKQRKACLTGWDLDWKEGSGNEIFLK